MGLYELQSVLLLPLCSGTTTPCFQADGTQAKTLHSSKKWSKAWRQHGKSTWNALYGS
jgi:hypothetical protein